MKISLVVPVKNEERSIEMLTRSIDKQSKVPDEVIFVDAGSTDRTREIIERHKNTEPYEIRIISVGPAYPGKARNIGAKEAKYEFIAFTDGGIELDTEWLEELSSLMGKDTSIDVVYGNYIPRTDTFFKKCLALAFVPPMGSKGIRPRFLASSLLKKSVWEKVGGFPDFRAAEDRIFMERIEEKGFKTVRNPRSFVIWDIPDSVKKVFKRFYSYSYHDLIAKRTQDWHLPVMKMYLIALFFIFLGMAVSPFFLLFPVLGFLLRVVHKISINKDEPYLKLEYIPLYLVTSGFLIFLIDIAMFAGWIRYILRGRSER